MAQDDRVLKGGVHVKWDNRLNPIIGPVYHGSPAYIADATDLHKGKDFGIHFGTEAQAWGRLYKRGGDVIPALINIDNLKRERDTGHGWRTKIRLAKQQGYDGIVYLNRYEGLFAHTKDEFIDRLASHGYSLLVLRKMHQSIYRPALFNEFSDEEFKKIFPEASDSYIVFERKQIKPYTGWTSALTPEGSQNPTKSTLKPKILYGIHTTDSLPFETFKTPEVWFDFVDAGYGENSLYFEYPYRKPFVTNWYDAETYPEFKTTNAQAKINFDYYQKLGGEVEPKAFDWMRAQGYDLLFDINGLAVLYPERMFHKVWHLKTGQRFRGVNPHHHNPVTINWALNDTGTFYYNQFFSDPEYMRRSKGVIGQVVTMTPAEYFRYAALSHIRQLGKHSPKDKLEREYNSILPGNVKKLASQMEAGSSFEIPFIDLSNRGKNQEGRHRVLAAASLGVDSVPVLIIRDVKESRLPNPFKKTIDDMREHEYLFHLYNYPKARLVGSVDGDILFIDNLEVDSNVRYQGRGTHLVEALEEWAKKQGIRVIQGDAVGEEACSFWRKMGYKLGRDSGEGAIRMHKVLK